MDNSKDKMYGNIDDYDIQKLCEKHKMSSHNLILLATRVARDGNMSPSIALKKLHEIDNIKDYLIQLDFNRLQDE